MLLCNDSERGGRTLPWPKNETKFDCPSDEKHVADCDTDLYILPTHALLPSLHTCYADQM